MCLGIRRGEAHTYTHTKSISTERGGGKVLTEPQADTRAECGGVSRQDKEH